MVKKTKKQKIIKVEVKETRNFLMLQAKDRGIKNFRVLNKEELREVLADGVSEDRIAEVVTGAVTRWKSGWGNRKDKS